MNTGMKPCQAPVMGEAVWVVSLLNPGPERARWGDSTRYDGQAGQREMEG